MEIAILEGGRATRPGRPATRSPANAPARPSQDDRVAPGILRDLLTVFLLFVALRGALFGFNYVGRSFTQEVHPRQHFPSLHPYWDGWVRWDSAWYGSVVEGGYFLQGEDLQKVQSNVAFFPLFPYAVRAATKLVGWRNHWYTGLFISNLSTMFGLFFMLRIARRHLGEEGARRSLVYLLLFPSSFFFSAYYSEGLFLLTTTASFYFFLGRRYFLCSAWGFLAALTRSPGLALFPAFVLGHLWDRRAKISRDDLPMFWLLLIPCGLLTFMALLQIRAGDPFAVFRAHAAWDRKSSFFLRTLWVGLQDANWRFPFDALNMMHIMNTLSSVVFLTLPFFLLKKFDKSLAIYSLLVIVMPLSTGAVLSMLRLELAAFPAFFVLAQLGEKRYFDRFLVFTFSIYLGLLNLGFTNGYFVV